MSVSSFLVTFLKNNFAIYTEADEFCSFVYQAEEIKLCLPARDHLWELVAFLKRLSLLEPKLIFYFRPGLIPQRECFALCKNQDKEAIIETLLKQNCKFLVIAQPLDFFLVILTETCCNTTDEQKELLSEKLPDFLLSIDAINIDFSHFHLSRPASGTTYINRLFSLEKSQSNYKNQFMMASDIISDFYRTQIKDRKTLKDFILSNENANFINLQDPMTIHSAEFWQWMAFLSPDPSLEEIKTGVLLMNRVIAQCHTENYSYVVKTSGADENSRLMYWTIGNAGQTLKKLFYFESQKDDEESKTEQPHKRRRKEQKQIFWFDVWQKHALRAEINDVVFKPWSLNNPDCSQFYDPELAYVSVRSINQFEGWPVTKEEAKAAYMSPVGKASIDLFRYLIEEMFCGGNKTYSEFIFKWFAFLVQKPNEKSKVAIIIRSQMGIGKGFLGKILDKWFGRHYYFLSGTSPTVKFNSFMQRKKVIFIDEVKSVVGDISILNSLITEPKIVIEKKGIDQSNETNLAEFIGGTNDALKINLTTDTRRWLIIDAPTRTREDLDKWKLKMNEEHDNILNHPEYKSAGAWALLFYFLDYDITGFVPNLQLPKTEAVKKCIEMSLHPVLIWWKWCLEHRRILKNVEPNDMLEKWNWTWTELMEAHRTNDEWESLYGITRTKLSTREFSELLLKVMDLVPGDGPRFKLRSWRLQEVKWKTIYSDVAIIHTFHDPISENPFTVNHIKEIEPFTSVSALDCYSNAEKNYMIMQLKTLLDNRLENSRVKFYPSVYSTERIKNGAMDKKILEIE